MRISDWSSDVCSSDLETQSREKMDTLRALGAELVLVPAAPYSNPNHFVHTSRRIAEETPGALWADQFDNTANRFAHLRSEERRVGKECVSTCKSRWWPYH